MAYATVVELQGYAGIEDDKDNGLLQQMIDRATAKINDYVGFSFEASADTTRTFDAAQYPDGDVLGRELLFDTWIASITTVTNGDSTTVASTDYVTNPRNDAPFYSIKLKRSSGLTWEYDSDNDTEDAISVTGKWAYSATVNNNIKQATLRLALWYYRQRDNSTDLDRPLLADGVTIMPSRMPQDVIDILNSYRWRGNP